MKKTDSTTELERYELYEDVRYRFELHRRTFLKLVGGGIVFVFPMRSLTAQESGRRESHNDTPQEINAWIQIAPDGSIRVFTGKAEMGQNIRTSLTQAVAEELRVPLSKVTLVMADTDQTPFDMGTFGSRTTPYMAPQLRKAAAAAREALIDLAAQQWKVDRSAVQLADGKIVNDRTHESITFANIAKGKNLVQAIPQDVAITAPAATSAPKIDGRDFVTGKHLYPSDMKLPGMLHGAVVRPSAFNAILVSADLSDAQGMLGVTVVRDRDFIGVAAVDPATARHVAGNIKAEWKAATQPSNAELVDLLQKPTHQSDDSHSEPAVRGSIDSGLSSADKKLEETYTVAYIAHVPLEPRAAVAEWKDGKLTVWTGTQRPFGVRDELVEAFRLPAEKVRVIVPDTGSAYGGKHTGECAIEAARIAKAAGKPVKLVWSREEEFTWAYFRPAGVIRVKSGATSDGKITAWEFHNYNSGPAGIDSKYDIANQHLQFHPADSPLRHGSYRALAATANHFARETHIDELAASLKMDPLEFRLRNTTDPRLRDVLTAAANKFGWDKQKPASGHGYGIACGFEKNDYIATCVEVAVESSKVKIVRVVESFDCGAVVNPEHLKNQIEGAILMGIGGALFEEIKFENGKILNAQLSNYRVPRFSDLPDSVEVVLVDRKDVPSAGAGETAIVGIAPAIDNAIFQATGNRLRAMPLKLSP